MNNPIHAHIKVIVTNDFSTSRTEHYSTEYRDESEAELDLSYGHLLFMERVAEQCRGILPREPHADRTSKSNRDGFTHEASVNGITTYVAGVWCRCDLNSTEPVRFIDE